MQNAHILDMLLDSGDDYPFSEERRLFYVALTRAKKRTTLLTTEGTESVFAAELRPMHAGKDAQEGSVCPMCGGHMVKRSGPHGAFLGCSNYRTKGCRYKI